jgi:hypothetical protein
MKRKMAKVGMLIGIAVAAAGAAPTMQLYFLQDMLAALLLFSLAFSVVAVMILILFLLDQGLDRAVACAGCYAALAALRLRCGCVQVGRFARERFHRAGHPVERTIR